MTRSIEEQEKNYNKFQGFLLVIVIPFLFAITVTLVILTFLGINIFDKAEQLTNKIPFISSNNNGSYSVKEYESKIIELEGVIKDREAEINLLETEIANKDASINHTELEKQRLQDEIDELVAIQEENKRAFKEVLKTYESISANKAASIITNMNQDEALKILSNVKSENLAAILEKMEPSIAAKYTELLTNEQE